MVVIVLAALLDISIIRNCTKFRVITSQFRTPEPITTSLSQHPAKIKDTDGV